MSKSSAGLVVAGLDAAQWAKDGVTIGPPLGQTAFSAEQVQWMGLKRFTGCTKPVATLVQMDMPTSQVVQSTTCWAISMTPSPEMSFIGPAVRRTPPPPPAHMVVFLNARTGRMVITKMWS
ncbi:MAG: hypothetical protein WA751_11440 [Candidatus Dormiibacterota bacterium]